MKLYYLIGRLSTPVQIVIFFVYNKVFNTPRARILVWNEHNELLLVRNWSGEQQWSLPGGGVERGERPVHAAKRELYEEVGVHVPVQELRYVATIHHQYEAWIYSSDVPMDAFPATRHNPWEITDMQWFSLEKMPTDISPLIPLALKNYQKQTDVGIIK